MALIKCSKCGHEVSDRASACPKCGTPIVQHNKENMKKNKGLLLACVVVAIIGIICGLSSLFSKDNTPTSLVVDSEIEVVPKPKENVVISNELAIAVKKYQEIRNFNYGMAAVKRGNKWGYINSNGTEVVSCIYDEVEDFKEGYGTVKISGKCGVVNTDGKETIKPSYDNILSFSHGLAAAYKDKKLGYINGKGDIIIPFDYDVNGSGTFTNDGIALVSQNGKYGFINTKGETITPIKYEYGDMMLNGYATVKLDGKFGYVNVKGEEVIPFRFIRASYFSEGWAMVRFDDDKWVNYIDEKGETKLSIQTYGGTKSYGNFHDGLALTIYSNYPEPNRYGFVNKDAREVIPIEFEDARDFRDGLAWIKIYGRSSYINTDGKSVVSDLYSEAGIYSDGLISVMRNGLWGYVDTKGEEIIECRYAGAKGFSEGVAVVYIEENGSKKYGFVDKKGNDTFTDEELMKFVESNAVAEEDIEDKINETDDF